MISIQPAAVAQRPKLSKDAQFGGLRKGSLGQLTPAKPTGQVKLFLSDNKMDDLWLALGWGK